MWNIHFANALFSTSCLTLPFLSLLKQSLQNNLLIAATFASFVMVSTAAYLYLIESVKQGRLMTRMVIKPNPSPQVLDAQLFGNLWMLPNRWFYSVGAAGLSATQDNSDGTVKQLLKADTLPHIWLGIISLFGASILALEGIAGGIVYRGMNVWLGNLPFAPLLNFVYVAIASWLGFCFVFHGAFRYFLGKKFF